LREGLKAMGLKLLARPEYAADTLTTVYIPDGVNDAPLRQSLLNEFGIEIGGGLGPLRGKIWRIGLMGESSTARNILAVLSALEQLLRRQGFEMPEAAGISAAQKALFADTSK
ncbi:MAG: alanine--glyoxylate aminotransferase family protein, partial [Chloroflexi bacterium]|nr:alanine--glyoxylate aminotransferase family protein [Chloroflexota bacterium]